MVTEKKLFFGVFFIYFFFHFKCMGANEARGVANLDPRVMVGRIYVGNHLT